MRRVALPHAVFRRRAILLGRELLVIADSIGTAVIEPTLRTSGAVEPITRMDNI